MIPAELIPLVTQFGTWIIFLWLYIGERNRNAELQDKRQLESIEAQERRIQELKEHNLELARILANQSIIDVKNALLDQTQSKRDG